MPAQVQGLEGKSSAPAPSPRPSPQTWLPLIATLLTHPTHKPTWFPLIWGLPRSRDCSVELVSPSAVHTEMMPLMPAPVLLMSSTSSEELLLKGRGGKGVRGRSHWAYVSHGCMAASVPVLQVSFTAP